MRPRNLPLLVLLMLAMACGSERDPTEPPLIEPPVVGGRVSAVLESPNGTEGGVLVHLVGSGVTEVVAVDGNLFMSVSGDTITVLLLRENPGELAFTFAIPNREVLPEIQILQVTGEDNQLRTDLSGYSFRTTS